MDDSTCYQCGESFQPRDRRQRFCSSGCRLDAQHAPRSAVYFPACEWCGAVFAARGPTKRPACGSEECQRKKNAKRLRDWRGKWKARHGSNYRERFKVERPCVDCGTVRLVDPNLGSQFCRSCSARRNAVKANEARRARGPGRALVGPVPASFCVIPERHPARSSQSKQRIFVEGPCAWCGERFCIVDQATARFCSKRCRKAAGKYAAGRFLIADSDRIAIYERDGWVCQLCGDPVDRDLGPSDVWAATLDHIVPRSKGGSDDFDNLRLAHRWCNSVRGDETYYDESMLKAG